MIRNVICLFCLFFMLSCKSIDLYYPNYANCSGYKSLYVVDTIQIDDPVSVLTNSGYCFVMSKQAFDSFSGNEDSLFKRPDYYNGAYTGFDGPPTINLRNNKFSFYKIAIPCYLK